MREVIYKDVFHILARIITIILNLKRKASCNKITQTRSNLYVKKIIETLPAYTFQMAKIRCARLPAELYFVLIR